MKILGILNITEDSFSDGGEFLTPEAALAQGRALLRDADILDIGAVSSNPDSKPVPTDVEIARLQSALTPLKAEGAAISIDSFAPETQRWALQQGVDYLNDIHGFAEPALYPELAAADAKLIVMHAVLARGIATRDDIPSHEILDRAVSFFERRVAALTGAGIARERLILDPGMGFFVGSDPENSLTLLRRLPDLKARFGLPLLVSVSRKSFLRKLTGRQPEEASAASLAAELFAEANGVDYIRTHAPRALRDGVNVLKAIGNSR
ncbi:MAG TPA: dihydropteroate synthase [Rhizomicrobium sp.]